MCQRCDQLIQLIKQTRGGESFVVTGFPSGTPQLVTRNDWPDAASWSANTATGTKRKD